MASRSRGDPAAKCRIFKALRKMPQRNAVRLELAFQRWTEDAAFDQCGARGLIHLDDLAEMAQVKCHGRLVTGVIDARLHATANA